MLAASAWALAQDKTVRIEFEGEGGREVWIQAKGEEGAPTDRTPVSGKAVEIEAPSETKDKTVFVRDIKTGNVATRALDEVVKSGSWLVKPADETHTYAMVFLIAHDDKPVTSAVVKLKSGDEERQTLLTPKDMGMASFLVVPYGEVQLTVEYETEGADKALPPQTFEAKPGMAEAGPITVSITDDVETASPETEKEDAPAGGADEPKKEDEEKPVPTNPVGTIINMAIGLLLIGGVAYGIWRYVQANPEKTADTLQKAGVPMPGDPAATAAAPKKAGPPQQILLGDAAPEPAAGPVVAAAAPAVKNPRLVRNDGSLYIVQDGDQTVGREGASYTLGGESSVSRTHARLTRTGDIVTIEDAGSTNGTFVNGQRLSGPTVLSPGDTVQFGAVQARYEE